MSPPTLLSGIAMENRWLASLIFDAAVSACFCVIPGASDAHSWYPPECCSDRDCFSAEVIERLPDGTIAMRHGSITIKVLPSFPIQASPDGDAHFCVWESGIGYEPRCVFLPFEF